VNQSRRRYQEFDGVSRHQYRRGWRRTGGRSQPASL
jgi:hypothetical protein